MFLWMLNSNQLESKQLKQMFTGNNAEFKMAPAGRMLNKSISFIYWVMILYKVE